MNIRVYRKDRAELAAEFDGVEVVIYDESNWYGPGNPLNESLLKLDGSRFELFKVFYADNKRIRDAFHQLVCSWQCSGMETIQPQHMKSEDLDLLIENGLLTADELEVVNARRAREAAKQVRAENQNKPTSLYLMKDERTGFYKIGRSNNPVVRERTLQSDNPQIFMVGTWPGAMKNEKELHACFADKRVRGEWFDLTEHDVLLIQQVLTR